MTSHFLRSRAVVLAGVLTGVATFLPFARADVGTLPGSLTVDNKGTANYSIPLAVPPGRSGMQPSLTLSYNSQRGNGPLGIGWSLSTGFPEAITRGRTILARDEVVRGVNYDSEDKLYLDGKRLILTGGDYLEPGSTYRTEVESFVTVSASGTDGKIYTFTVLDKGGNTFVFGKSGTTSDAYQPGEGETAGLTGKWALKRVQDAIGNSMVFNYNETALTGTPGDGEHVLSSILYTAHDAEEVAAQFKIKLYYNEGSLVRQDKQISYTGGRYTTGTRRLDAIVATDASDAVVRKFQLNYEYATVTGTYNSVDGDTVLKSVELRDASNTVVIPASTFDYTNTVQNYSAPTQKLERALADDFPSATAPRGWFFKDVKADFNHDGVVDLVYRAYHTSFSPPSTTQSLKVFLSIAGGGYSSPIEIYSSNRELKQAFAEDFNGDGFTDLVFFSSQITTKSGGWYVSLNQAGQGFGSPTKLLDEQIGSGATAYTTYREGGSAVKDMDGDGLADIVTTHDASPPTPNLYGGILGFSPIVVPIWRIFSIETGLVSYGDAYEANWTYSLEPADDFLVVYRNTTTGFSPSLATPVNTNVWMNESHLMVHDFTGDGLPDLLLQKTNQVFDPEGSDSAPLYLYGNFRLLKNSGGLAFTEKSNDGYEFIVNHQGARAFPAVQQMPGDFNGDGVQDLLRFVFTNGNGNTYGGPGTEGWNVGLGKGDGTFDWTTFPTMPLVLTYGTASVQTFNYDPALSGDWGWGGFNPEREVEYVSPPMLDGFHVHDVDRDGRDDFVWFREGQGVFVVRSAGTHFATDDVLKLAEVTGLEDDARGTARIYLGDLNGNGIDDVYYFQPQYSTSSVFTGWKIHSASLTGSADVKLASVVNGLGRKTDIAYKPGTDPAVYTQGTATQYPIATLATRAPVVSDVWHDAGNGVSGDRSQFSYQYSGRRLDLSGRGDLGFHSFITLDRQTNLFKYQFLAQSFPMTGLTHREETYRYWLDTGHDHFRFLSSHDNTVVFDKVTSGGATLWPFISQAVESRWEDSTTSHFNFAVGPANAQSEALFPQTKPTGAHITITATSRFDEQTASQLTLPGVTGYNPSDTNSSAQNVVAGTTDYSLYSGLPGKITYGNLIKLSTDFGDGFTETVDTTYKSPVGALTGLVNSVTSTVASTGYGTQTAPVKSYTYWESTPLVATETSNAPGEDLDLTTTYERDDLGRITSTTVAGQKLQSTGQEAVTLTTATFADFDATFDLAGTAENAYEHATTTTYHAHLGAPTSVTDVNGAEVTTEYDALGRATLVKDLLKGLETVTSFASDTSETVSVPSGVTGVELTSTYRVTVTSRVTAATSTILSEAKEYFDRLGRSIRKVTVGYNGALTLTDTVYNKLGQVVAISNPYPSGGTAYWTKTTYDSLGRVATVTAPNGTVTTYAYQGRATKVTVDAPNLGGVNPDAQTQSTLVDAKGRTVKVWNADNVPTFSDTLGTTTTTASIAFALDGFGRMRTTTLKDQTQTITATYDAYGRQLSLNDPDKGSWTYLNSALGHVLQQTDARLNVTNTTYDKLGRALTRTTTEPSSGPVETAQWFYYDDADDSAAHQVAFTNRGWIGALQREESSTSSGPGYAAANSATTTVHYYDDKGRPSVNLVTIDGKWFYTYTDYDTASRVANVHHFWRPAGHEAADNLPYVWQDFGYSYTYDSRSFLTSLTDSLSRTWWQADSTSGYDYLGRPVLVRKGNGHWTKRLYRATDEVLTAIQTGPTAGSTSIQNLTFSFDGLGNLRERTGSGGTETLSYDILNRLTDGAQGAITYFDNGNIKRKPDVSGTNAPADYVYDTTHPHAVTSAFGYTMGYDASGNLSSRTKTGESWSFRYAGFDKPRWMAKTAGGVTAGSEFLYNANRSRTVHLEFDAVSSGVPSHYTRKRVYGLGATLEANYGNSAASGTPVWSLQKVRIYVPGPDGIIGAREFDPAAPVGSQEKALVYHHDHLGSIESITAFGSNVAETYAADASGKSGRYSEDAWGQRRDPLDWAGAPASTTDDGGAISLTPRGFTGHEMLDDLGLVHMNGRIYDPLVGRFLSADIIVQFPGGLQSYNRYSYVRNNPLTNVDLTGFNEMVGRMQQPLAEAMMIQHLGAEKAGRVIELNHALDRAIGVAMGRMAAGMTPPGQVIGTINDVEDLGHSSAVVRFFAGASLALDAMTGGLSPNFGLMRRAVIQGSEEIAETAARIARQEGNALSTAGAPKVEIEAPTPKSVEVSSVPPSKGGNGSGGGSGGSGDPSPTPSEPELQGPLIIPNNATVVRGGSTAPGGGASAEGITSGSGVVTGPNGMVSGVSVNAGVATVGELAVPPIRNTMVGVTTAGEIRAAGGAVTPNPSAYNPSHALVSDITAEELSKRLKQQRNPNK